jgi:iron complex transport system substrate-binding protein
MFFVLSQSFMKKKTKAVHFISCLMLLGAAFSAGSCKGKFEFAKGAETPPASAGSAGGLDYGQVTITNGDRTVTFTKMPERVVAFNSYITENMLALGLGGRIAATSAMSPGNTPLAEFAEEYAKIPEIQRSHEVAISYDPELVAGQVSTFTDRAWGTVEMFLDKGINSYIISGTLAEDETIDNVYEYLENLGKIFKNEIYTTPKGLESQLIELAGGINVTRGESPSRWFNTSVETLVERNPDVIIFNVYGTVPVEDKIAFINENPALAHVTAVKNRNYVIIPLQNVMQDVRAADTVQTLAKAFYPDLF